MPKNWKIFRFPESLLLFSLPPWFSVSINLMVISTVTFDPYPWSYRNSIFQLVMFHQSYQFQAYQFSRNQLLQIQFPLPWFLISWYVRLQDNFQQWSHNMKSTSIMKHLQSVPPTVSVRVVQESIGHNLWLIIDWSSYGPFVRSIQPYFWFIFSRVSSFLIPRPLFASVFSRW